jgi:hypothetical protein
MTRVQPRTHLHNSALLRFLDEKGMVDARVDTGDIGLRLGDWLDFRQAIALQGFIGAVDRPARVPAQPTARVDAQVLRRRFAQVREALELSITQGTPPAPGTPRLEMPATELAQPIDTKTAFDPYRRYCSGHQRQMETIIRSLRSQLRGMLDKGSEAHRQLAALDAILDNILSVRETRLLGQITTEFEKRFAKALKQHMKQLLQAAQQDEPAPRTQVWLAPLCEDMRSALLAELDLRLQPLLGLIEALTQDKLP